MLSVEAVMEEGVFGVELVENGVGVVLVAGRENYDLPFAGHLRR